MKVLTWLLQVYLIVTLPALLAIGAGRLLMNHALLEFEYTRTGFPVDSYGLTTEDRLQYGPMGIQYILNNEPISYLGDLELEGAKCYPVNERPCPAFNPFELDHMEDVQAVAQMLFRFALWGGIAWLVAAVVLGRFVSISALRSAIINGSFLTLGLIATIILVAILAWDTFFSGFHSMFFAEGSWQFYYSDTLIRLYPEQFWFDAALSVGVLTVVAALVLWLVGFRMPNKS
jgi:integral membrane protein (TIGR01906 family)